MTLPWKSAEEIRQTFLEYFLRNNHEFIEPSGVIPRNDPTLMFINSGMAPLKPFFLGQARPPFPRLVNVQDCIRFVDLDSVGDSHHGTSFRMMGSWSFGDYFKERAIELAFELVTDIFGFPSDRLSATVFVADESLPGIPDDEESARIWRKFLPQDRILPRPPADNFWGPPGIVGPCGPCTEVFFDRGAEFGSASTGDPLVSGRHIEIWNAGVFMQYFKDERGNYSPLPMNCVDTGAGLERFAMILQERPSIHEIDQYEGVFRLVNDRLRDPSWSRIVLDHLKTSLLMLRERVTPSNQREGYLLRRALRRAMLGVFLKGVEVKTVRGWMGGLCECVDDRRKTASAQSAIFVWLDAEISSFEGLMRRSQKHLDRIVAEKHLDAQHAFDLKTSLGVPEDLLEEYCRRHGIEFPREGLASLLREHQQVSRKKNVKQDT